MTVVGLGVMRMMTNAKKDDSKLHASQDLRYLRDEFALSIAGLES